MRTRFKVMKVACTGLENSQAREIRMSPVPAVKDDANKVFVDQTSPGGEIFLLVADGSPFRDGDEFYVDITPVA